MSKKYITDNLEITDLQYNTDSISVLVQDEVLGSESANYIDGNITLSSLNGSIMTSLSGINYNATAIGDSNDARPRIAFNLTAGLSYAVEYIPITIVGATTIDVFANNTRVFNNRDAGISLNYELLASSTYDGIDFDGSLIFDIDYTLSIREITSSSNEIKKKVLDLTNMDLNTTDRHNHSNKVTLDKFGENGSGLPTYNGNAVDTTIAQRDVNDTLTSSDNTISLSAKQGKVLKDVQDTQQTAINLNTAKTSYPGDQDLSGYLLNTSDTLTGTLIIDGGIGVTSSGVLHVRQKGDTVADGIAITSSHGTSHRIWKDVSGNLKLTNSSGTGAVIDLSGNITATNLSGTNTGDQDLSGYVKIAGDIMTGNLNIERPSGDIGTLLIKGGNNTVTAVGEVNSEINFGSNDGSATGRIGGSIKSITELANGAYVGMGFYTAKQSRVPVLKEGMRLNYDGDLSVVGNISATNLSGTNTGDQDLSSYITTSTADDKYTKLDVNTANSTFNPAERSQYSFSGWDANGASWTPDTGWWWGMTMPHVSNTSTYNYSGQFAIKNSDGAEAYVRTVSNSGENAWRQVWTDNTLMNVSQLTNDAGYITTSTADGKYLLNTTDTLNGNLYVTGTGSYGGRLDITNSSTNLATLIENSNNTVGFHGLKVNTVNTDSGTRVFYATANLADALVVYGDKKVKAFGVLEAVGNISAANLSGINTGDQDLSSYITTSTADGKYLLNTSDTLNGSLSVSSSQGARNTSFISAGNGGWVQYESANDGIYGYVGSGSHLLAPVVNDNDFVVRAQGEFVVSIQATEKFRINSSGNATFKNTQTAESLLTLDNTRNDAGSVPFYGIAGNSGGSTVAKVSFNRGSGSNSGYLTFDTKVDNATALSTKMTLSGGGNLNVVGTITGSNLSGTNTGDQDLSDYVTLSTNQTITGDKQFNSFVGINGGSIAGSVLTISKSTDVSGTGVGTFHNINHTGASAGATMYGEVLRLQYSGTADIEDLIGGNTIGRNLGSGDVSGIYGHYSQSESNSSSALTIGDMFGAYSIAKIENNGTQSITNQIAGSFSKATADNPNATIASTLGANIAIEAFKGSLGNTSVLYLNMQGDYSTPDASLTIADFAYIKAEDNFAMPNVTGTSHFINSSVPLPSLLAGSMEATSFIKTGGTSSQFLKADGSVDTNTYSGDQDLSGYLLNTTDTLNGVLTVSSKILAKGEIINSSAALQVNGFQRTGNIYLHSGGNTPDTAHSEVIISNVSGNLLINKDISASNLSGTNTGDQDLSGYQPAGTYNGIIGTDSDINTSGALVVDQLNMTDGVITSHSVRSLTAANIGAADTGHKYHSFANGQVFTDTYAQGNYLRLFTENAVYDTFRFRDYTNVQSFDGTNWNAWSQSLDVLFDGREETSFHLLRANKSFRFEINRSSGWPTIALFSLQTSWSNVNTTHLDVILETWSGSAWVVKDTKDFNGFTRGTNLWATSATHDGKNDMRVTINCDWTDASHNYINLKRILFLSNFSGGQVLDPWSWNYAKKVTFQGDIQATNFTGSSEGTNTGDQDLSGYLLNTTDTLSGVLTIEHTGGTTLILKDTNSVGNAANPYINFEDSAGTRVGYVGMGSGGNSILYLEGLGGVRSNNDFSSAGTITGTNLSGTNTGDQNLSGYLLNTTDTLTGNLTVTNRIYADTYFESTDNAVVLAPNGAGTVYLRPNGADTGTGAFSLNSSGNATFAGNVSLAGRILNTYTGTGFHEIQNGTNNGIVLRLTSTGDNRALTLQSDHIYSNGNFFIGDNSYQTNFRGSSYDFANGNATFGGSVNVESGLNLLTNNKVTFDSNADSWAYIKQIVYAENEVPANGMIYAAENGHHFINGEDNAYDYVTAGSFVADGGTGSQFLKANGSRDSSEYLRKDQSDSSTGTITASNFILSSDIRLKKDFLPLESRRLQPTRWTWKDSNEKDFGFIAQELEIDFPEVVVTGEDGFKKVAYNKITAINASRINDLEDEVSELKDKLNKLMKHLNI